MANSLNLLPASYADFRREAERRLPRFLFDYIDGGAGAEVTLRRNTADWEAVQLTQKVLRDASKMDCSVELFGESLAMPLVLAPVGMGGMTARRGEVQAKRAADKAGIPFCLTTVGVCSPEEVARVSEKPFWFQLYMLRDRGVVQDILARAWDQGVRTLAFTIDLAVLGTRYRDIRNGMTGGLGPWGKLRAGPIDYALHPRWVMDVGLRGRPHGLGTVAKYVPGSGSGNIANFMLWMAGQFDPSVTWKDIEWLRGIWKGNLVLKGILDVEDARQAVAIGADGMVISNHGGRQLDGVASSISKLPSVVAAVGDRMEVYMDGGVRSGVDVFKAVALGAKGVMIGRPWVWALATGGQTGVRDQLALMKQELRVAMALSGVNRISEIGPDAIDDASAPR